MKLYIKYDINVICKKILQEQLDKLDLSYALVAFGEVEIKEAVAGETLKELYSNLSEYGIEIVESSKSILIQKIKDAIIEMVYMEEKLPTSKISAYLADKLGYSYGYISNIFADVTYTSIENFIILQRIEFAKQLITIDELSFTEIAHRLNYSSLAHFCTQFKNTTGLTPSVFKRIIIQRRSLVKNI
ncbi:helix-turn-helix domain-containing protein [Emticicia sp. SJ17W-69]|uniref:helix-turn-helix domain-containing protein n=1 Tax=Emticicia sp. SJ17W-69 TaxID=3421657 RepID=UPI003EC044BE